MTAYRIGLMISFSGGQLEVLSGFFVIQSYFWFFKASFNDLKSKKFRSKKWEMSRFQL
jgi:hypothetical protein